MSEYWQQFLLFINYDDFSETLARTLGFLRDQFVLLRDNAPWVLAIYVVVVLFLFFAARKIYSGFVTMRQSCNYEIDKVHYKFALMIYRHRDEIYNFAETIKVLYSHKTEILEDPSRTFLSDVDDLQKDVQYLEQLLDKRIVSDEQRERIIMMRAVVMKGRYMYLTLMGLIALLTIGIGNLFQKKATV